MAFNFGGRPKKYNTTKELEDGIKSYFDKVTDEGGDFKEIPTIGMLCVHLDIHNDTLFNYEQDEKFFVTIKKARNIIESAKVNGLVNGKGSTAGLIFDLKNNHGYTDKQEVKQTGNSQISIINNSNEQLEALNLDD